MNSKNLWIDESNAAEWAELCHKGIAEWLSAIVGEQPGDSEFSKSLQIDVRPPQWKAAQKAFESNRTLEGQISFRWRRDDEILGKTIRIPMPYHGVFFFHREGAGRALPSVWPSWLAERHGFRIILPTDEKKRQANQKEWRLGLPDGSWVGAPLKPVNKLSQADEKSLCRKQPVYVGQPAVPDWLAPALSLYGPGPIGKQRSKQPLQSTIWASLHDHILKDGGSDRELSPASDEDDLEHKMLMTFPVWLRQRVSWGLLQAMLPAAKRKGRQDGSSDEEEPSKNDIRHRIADILTGQEDGDPALVPEVQSMLWDSLGSLAAKIHFSLNNHRSTEKTDYIEPVNPLDLVARITRVRRFHTPSRFLEEKAEEFRQNHPSFEGRICPVDSPESGMVGLTLHLAAGATVDLHGHIFPAEPGVESLGFGAGLIPFFGHNDGARNMMGAKNLRQAIPLHGAETPAVLTGGERIVAELAKPLADIGVCPNAVDADGQLRLGRDLLVAYMPWYGLNMEDAVVVSETAAQGLGCENLRKPPVRKPVPVDWLPTAPKNPQEAPELDESGMIRKGTKVYPGTALACFAYTGKSGRSREKIIRYQDRTPATVRRIEFHKKNEWTTGSLEVEFELPIPARPGDKLMGRHGNKGVIGTILPADQMPRLPDSEKLPENLRGRAIDILLNPHGVVGRMNLGQLLETHVGWLMHAGYRQADIVRANDAPESPAKPFSDTLDHDKVQAHLEATGLDRYGRVNLVFPDGGETLAPVVVGFQHLVRLRHIPELKSQARRGGGDALYSARTGQAIHGRKLGGGQRVGEMEIWALAGHQADAVLTEMLGSKSSADLLQQETGMSEHTGYSRLFRDWLFAMGIDLNTTDEEVDFQFLDPSAILERIGKDNRVTVPGGIQSRLTASFRCHHGTKNHPCQYTLLGGEEIAFRPHKGEAPTLTLADLLQHLQLEPAHKLVRAGDSCCLALKDATSGRPAGKLDFSLDADGDTITGVGRFIPETKSVPPSTVADQPASFEQLEDLEKAMGSLKEPATPESAPIPDVHLYGRFGKGTTRGGGNKDATDVIEEFLETDPAEWLKGAKNRTGGRFVTDLSLICPHHAAKPVRGAKPYGEKFTSAPGGLLDPHIFGNYKTAFRNSHRWGYVELPVPVEFPLHVFLTKDKSPDKRAKAVEKFLKSLGDSGMPVQDVPMLRYIPVLPVRYRLPFRVDGRIVSNDLDLHGYIPVLQACRAYEEKGAKMEGLLKARVSSLFRQLAAAMGGKDGNIRHDGLGRRVDRSARLVITPNPSLPWDTAGIPTAVLWELMGDQVLSWKATLPGESARMLPEAPDESWLKIADNSERVESTRRLLEKYFEVHPDLVVLLNRQPSLHRDSFQAFKPRPLPKEAGDVIQLCPLVCKGFAADFDGDEMVIHFPVGEAAQADARRLLPSKNLFSLATTEDDGENVLAHFDQDFVMGTWLLGKADLVLLRETFLSLLPDGDIRNLAESWDAHPAKADGGKLLAMIARQGESPAETIWSWMQVALRACTRAGVSFGYCELREMAESITTAGSVECANMIDALGQGFDSEVDYNAGLEALGEELLGGKIESAAWGDPGYGFASIVKSGAKGRDEQVRQILVGRGLLHPGKVGFDPAADEGWRRFFIPRSLCEGLDLTTSFWSAMNARSSMIDKKLGTGYGGGLTRSLVYALWPCRITENDCGNHGSKRQTLTCRSHDGICAACYGELAGTGKLAPIGFPAGMVAAQSIGERGTQLSMQSFHGGSKVIDIHDARLAVKSPAKKGLTSYEDFVDCLKSANAYRKILDRHFEVVWRALNQQENRTLHEVIESQDGLAQIAYRHTPAQILRTVMTSSPAKRSQPAARLLTGGSAPL